MKWTFRRRRPPSIPVILLGVTVDQSLKLMRGFPSYLSGRGWVVHVVSAGDSGHSHEYYLGPSAGVRIHQLPMRRDPSPIADLRALLAWWRLLRSVRPDVVLLGTPKASMLGLMAATVARVPARVYLIRGFRFEAASGARRRLLRWFEMATAAAASHVVAVSPSLRDIAVSERVTSERRVHVLGAGSSNGVDIPTDEKLRGLRADRRQQLLDLGLDPDLPTIGYVGRLTRDKGVLDLAAASAQLARDEHRHQLLLVGAEDSPGYLAKLERVLKDGGVPYALTGYVEQPTEYMAVLDVFCLPSRREGMPNASLVAQPLQVPVVTSQATGCRDSVIEDRTGVTVRVGDVNALAAALAELVDDGDRREEMGVAGAEWVAREFDRGVVWARHETWLKDLLPRTRPPGSLT